MVIELLFADQLMALVVLVLHQGSGCWQIGQKAGLVFLDADDDQTVDANELH